MRTRKLRICQRVSTLFIQCFREETHLSRRLSAATVKNRSKSRHSLKSTVKNFFTASSLTTLAKIRRISNAFLDQWMCGFAWTLSSTVVLDTQQFTWGQALKSSSVSHFQNRNIRIITLSYFLLIEAPETLRLFVKVGKIALWYARQYQKIIALKPLFPSQT